MITNKKISDISEHFHEQFQNGYRSSAFGIYQNLSRKIDESEMVLLESLGPASNDSKTSMIGVKPTLKIEIFNLDVFISGNATLLNWIQSNCLCGYASLQNSSLLSYRLEARSAVWGFLKSLDVPFSKVEGGVLTFSTFAYNTVYFIEDMAGYARGDIPDISLTCYSAFIEFMEDRVLLHEYKFIGEDSIDITEVLTDIEIKNDISDEASNESFSVQRETLECEYLKKASQALEHVKLGDVYQIQIGQKLTIKSSISALEVYKKLRLLNPSPYMYLFNSGSFKVVGASPESFICLNADDLFMRPIAGTLGKNLLTSKEWAKDEFRSNGKEIAEHMMLVDLCRNDMCRVSVPQSLEVSELMSVEEYSHVYHMISTVSAKLKLGHDKYDVIKAAFPAGTMTGAPKIRAIELIAEIEDSGRGLYAGAIGIMGLGINYVNTALCIRTAIEHNGEYLLRASAGIVSDSHAENEYAETLHKMGSVFKAITGEEISCLVM